DRLIRGAHGQAGEIGHMTLLPGGPMGGDGHEGSLEAIAAGRSIARDGSYAHNLPTTTEDVFERARQGDRIALGIVDNATRFTGIGMANLVKTFDPEAFVLGGGLCRAGDFYLDRVRAAMEERLTGYRAPQVLLAELGYEAGVIGAAAVADGEGPAGEVSAGGPAGDGAGTRRPAPRPSVEPSTGRPRMRVASAEAARPRAAAAGGKPSAMTPAGRFATSGAAG